MRRQMYICLLTFLFTSATAQPTLQQKYYYTCKIWGFVKYYHSSVSNCNVNWDSVLLATLPAVRNAVNSNQFNDALITMLNAAGPMAISATYFPDTLPQELKRNRDFSWINTPTLRSDVQVLLDTIKNNFRPHPICWVNVRTPPTYDLTAASGGYLEFPFDSIALNVNTVANYPDEDHRLLMTFKFWNIISYFNPYNYVLDTSWDSTLYNYVVPIANAPDANTLYLLELNIATKLDDAHVYGLTYNTNYWLPPGYYKPYIRLKYVHNQYVVLNSLESNISPGDVIVSIDGLTMPQWEDSLLPYYSSGSIEVFRRSVCENILGRQNGINETLEIEDSFGVQHTHVVTCIWPPNNHSFFYDPYYITDSLATISWTTMPCDIGYVNMTNLNAGDVSNMYSDLSSKSAIIIDLRHLQTVAWSVANTMYPSSMEYAKLTYPDVTYPGTYYWVHDLLGTNGNPQPYTGKVILLMDEGTQSNLEFSCMEFEPMPNVLKVGSHTAGADGSVTRFSLSDDMRFGYTSLGVYSPNGDSTQRIGIVPDSVVSPTKAGIRHGRDEVLEKALQAAGCDLYVGKNIKSPKIAVHIFPNPASENIHIVLQNAANEEFHISCDDITGRVILTKDIKSDNQYASTSFDIRGLPSGIYFINIKTASKKFLTKFIKE